MTEYEVDDSEAIMKWLSGIRKRKVTIAMPKRGEKLHLVEMVRKNADIALGNYKIKVMKEREKNTVLDMMQEQLRLEKRPYRIEAYDISNIQGTDNVGAMVVFENGKPAKRKYRIFKIKSFEGADDYAAMREVIYRRFRHALEEEEQVEKGTLLKRNAKFLPLPDLILLDGGKGHLNVITELLDMIEVDIETFGMVKNDKHRTRGLVSKNGEIELSATSPVFKLITHIQDEVHDTAISYHRKLRGKINSELDKINGIGEKRRKALLTTFKTIDKIKEATLDELLNVKEMDSKHGFSTREGGVSDGCYSSMNFRFHCDDTRENVLKNFEIMADTLGMDYNKLVLSKQVHEDVIHTVTEDDFGNGIVLENKFDSVDALITDKKGIPMVTLFADCVPLFFLDKKLGVAALAHSGWKGTVKRIGQKTIEKMKRDYGSRAEDILTAIGPSIQECHFEVGDEVAEIFIKEFGEDTAVKYGEKYHVNMQKAIEKQFIESGILKENIDNCGICTYCNSDLLFSHRKTNGKRGNLGAFIELI